MPEGYVKPVFEAKGVAGKVPVTWALTTAPDSKASAAERENI